MDQIKIGAFLKELRKENNLSQEQLAENLNVSSRSISRWENGNTMPDISIIIELADYYDVDIREILNGERESEIMDKDLKETLDMVADYTEAEKAKILDKVYSYGVCSTAAFIILLIMYVFNLHSKTDGLNNLFIMMFYIGGIFSVSTIIAGLQLKGKMKKERIKKITLISLPICVILMVLLSVIIFLSSSL